MNKQTLRTARIITIIVVVVSIGFFALYVIADNCLPLGSRRPEERYRFNISETELINTIHKFKQQNPDFVIPKDTLLKLFPLQEEHYDTTYFIHYHYFNIYFKRENKVFGFSISTVPRKGSELELISILESPISKGDWVSVNQYLKGQKNKEVKKEFEEEFLDKLGIKYDKLGDSEPIFYHWFHDN